MTVQYIVNNMQNKCLPSRSKRPLGALFHTNVPLPTSITVYVAYMLSYELMSHRWDIDSDETEAIEELYSRSMAMLY